jgi:hypothetical protein
VGAGLPIIATLKHLTETGDKVLRIEGIFSGTLSYIFNAFGDGRPFSAVVEEAKGKVRVNGGRQLEGGREGYGGGRGNHIELATSKQGGGGCQGVLVREGRGVVG